MSKDLKKRLLVLSLGLLAFFAILIMPTPAGMTAPAQRLLGVVVMMAIWWMGEAIAIAATALLPLVLFPLLAIMPSNAVAPNYTNHLVFLFLGGFMIAIAMEKWGLHKRIALRIIAAIGTDTKKIVLGFMMASAFLSMWISNTATTMMMLPVAMAVVTQISTEAKFKGACDEITARTIQSGLGLVMMLGLAYSASLGGVGTLIGTPPNIIFAGFYENLYPHGVEITFVKWMMVALPLVVLLIPIVWIYLCRLVCPIQLDDIDFGGNAQSLIRQELKNLGPMSWQEMAVAIIFGATASLWCFRQSIDVGGFVIPGWSTLFENPDMFHDATVAMAMGLLLMLIPANLGGRGSTTSKAEGFLLDWDTVQRKTPWGILFLFGGGFALAAGFAETGLDQWIGTQLSGISTLPLVTYILVICVSITFLTELTSNTATTTMILPIIGATAVAANYPPFLLMVPATLSASFAFMLPVATPPNAIVYGSGWVTVAKMSRAGLTLNLLGAIVVTSVVLISAQRVFS